DRLQEGRAGRRRRQQFAGNRRRRTGCRARRSAEKAARQSDDGSDGLVRQHDRRKRGEAEGALRSERRADGSRLRPREGLRSLHRRAGEGLQGAGRIAAPGSRSFFLRRWLEGLRKLRLKAETGALRSKTSAFAHKIFVKAPENRVLHLLFPSAK